ncbi:hypothetical protein QUF76_15055 [Desulfobacterales bacterium HSG16]|nr:hypothetical protein [Desulfobacterales bacterium HSG16]
MREQPTYKELLNQVTNLETKLDEAQNEIDGLQTRLRDADNAKNQKNDPVMMDEEALKFAMAESKIDILEAFEYYLSQSSPACTLLETATNEYPEIGSIIEFLISSILTDIDSTWTRKKLIQFAIDVLQSDLDGAVDAKRGM